MPPIRVERDSRRASRIVANTSRAPNTQAEKRQPNEFIPNICSPTAINHLPSGGCTTNSGVSENPSTLPARIWSLAPSGQLRLVAEVQQ